MHPLSEARPYAQALFKLAKRKEQAENWGITLFFIRSFSIAKKGSWKESSTRLIQWQKKS